MNRPGRTIDGDLGGADVDGPRGRGALSRGVRLIPRMLPYLRPYWKEAIGSVTLIVALVVLALLEPWPLAFVADSVLDDARDPPGWVSAMFGDDPGVLIAFAVIATLLITLLLGAATVLQKYLTVRINEGMSLDFRSDLFQHVQNMSVAWHDGRETGMLLFRLNTQSRAVGTVATSLPMFAQHVLTVAAMAYVTYRIDALLAVLAMAVVPLVFASIRYYADRIEPQLLQVRGMEGRNLSIVHEAMQMFRIVTAFGRQSHEHERFRHQGQSTAEARVNLTLRQTLFRMGVGLVTAAGTAAVLGVGASRVLDGQITLGELLIVLAYVASVYAPLEALTSLAVTYQAQLIGFEHSLALLDERPDLVERDDAIELDRVRGRIAVTGVSFAYGDGAEVLTDISFEVGPGETLAIVGPTGAGKSTLVSLLPRFYDVGAGCITIDGHDVRDVTLDSLRRQFSIVPQEPLLFSGSIAENLRYARPDATPAELREATSAANADGFIEALPGGYQARVGERGSMISGGERQRLAVARAFLRDAPVLLLDEPTSSIDSRTEAPVLEALERLRAGRTTIVIAHRLATIRTADRVLVLDDGAVAQLGTFDELVATDGLLRELWLAQTGGPADLPGRIPTDHREHGSLELDHSGEAHRDVSESPAPTGTDGDLVVAPLSRRPLVLPPDTIDAVWQRPVPARVHEWSEQPDVSIVVPVHGGLVVSRLALESMLLEPVSASFELIVVDNASDALTSHYLRRLCDRNPNVRLIANDDNRGFAAAVNQGARAARADRLVVANNDVIVTPGWLDRLVAHLDDPWIGLVGPVTNRCGNVAEIATEYQTLGEMRELAGRRAATDARLVELDVAIMFCVALRTDTWWAIGPLDERFELGLFEDDDYSRRVRDAGLGVTCDESVFVHHFGEATIGELASEGRYGQLFHANRRRFEDKWGVRWEPHRRRPDPHYERLRDHVRQAIVANTPPAAVVAIVSGGDDELLKVADRIGRHLPADEHGHYLGHHPADDTAAIDAIRCAVRHGATHIALPAAWSWWELMYPELRRLLDEQGTSVVVDGVVRIDQLTSIREQTFEVRA